MFVARRRGLAAGIVVGAAAANAAHSHEQKKQQTTVVVVEDKSKKPPEKQQQQQQQPQQPQQGGYPPPGQGYPGYPPPSGYYPPTGYYPPPQGYGYPPPGSGYPPPPQGYPHEGYPPAPPQGYPPQGYHAPPGYPPPPQGYPPQGYPPAGYPPAPGSYPPGAYPPPGAAPVAANNPPPYAPHEPPKTGAPTSAPEPEREFEKRYFFLVNESNCYVLEVPRDNPKPGASLNIDKRRSDGPAHQLWYSDKDGVIRSKISDLAICFKESGDKVRLCHYTGDVRQKWILRGNRVVNEMFSDECIGLKKGVLVVHDDADVIASKYQGKPYQHWRNEYV